jgi:hypothetical protein
MIVHVSHRSDYLTQEKRMMSFSLPWKPSTVLMSTIREPSSPSAAEKLRGTIEGQRRARDDGTWKQRLARR